MDVGKECGCEVMGTRDVTVWGWKIIRMWSRRGRIGCARTAPRELRGVCGPTGPAFSVGTARSSPLSPSAGEWACHVLHRPFQLVCTAPPPGEGITIKRTLGSDGSLVVHDLDTIQLAQPDHHGFLRTSRPILGSAHVSSERSRHTLCGFYERDWSAELAGDCSTGTVRFRISRSASSQSSSAQHSRQPRSRYSS